MSLTFRSVSIGLLNRSLDLSSGNFYIHLVTTAPTDRLNSTVADLVLATGGNYAPFEFTVSPTLAINSNAGMMDFSEDPLWSSLNTDGSATIKGMVLCKRVGASIAASDPIISYNALPSEFTPNGTDLGITLATTGIYRLIDGNGLLFNNTLLGLLDRTLDLTTGVFYAHLVTTAPTDPTITSVSSLTLATGGNYAPTTIANMSSLTSGNAAILDADDPSWDSLTTDNAATIKGMVLCKQSGGAPANTDTIIAYKPLNSTQFPSGYTPNGATFTAQLGSTGLIELP